MGIGVSTLYRVYGKDRLRAALRPDANERFITTKEERDQAKDAKYSSSLAGEKMKMTKLMRIFLMRTHPN